MGGSEEAASPRGDDRSGLLSGPTGVTGARPAVDGSGGSAAAAGEGCLEHLRATLALQSGAPDAVPGEAVVRIGGVRRIVASAWQKSRARRDGRAPPRRRTVAAGLTAAAGGAMLEAGAGGFLGWMALERCR